MVCNEGRKCDDVFIHDIPDGFHRGCRVTINGSVPVNARRFSINLQCGARIQQHEAYISKRDVALHLNPRFNNGQKTVLIRNSYYNGMWDVEEGNETSAIQPGGTVNISISCHRHQFRVN